MIKPNTLFTGDNLPILRGMDAESVDLIYLDPPFNSNRTYSAPVGSRAAGAEFKDMWTLEDTDDAWWGELAEVQPVLYRVIDASGAVGGKKDKAYCIYMAIRLIELHRILKPSGSLYLHCDPTMSHSLKLVLDAIFGGKQFRNEIIWHYSGWNKRLPRHIERRHDVILFYAKSPGAHFAHPVRQWENKSEYLAKRRQKVLTDDSGKEYVLSDAGGGKRAKRYLDDAMKYGVPLDDVWDIPKLNNSDKERTGYPTQKPLALLRRVIRASSKPGGMVLDPFCGCATACVAAQDEGRNWAGIDISERAYQLVLQRFQDELGIFNPKIIHRTDVPQRAGMRRSKNIKHILFGVQQGVCNGCKTEFPFRNFQIDHIIPRAHGGADSDDNVQLLCGACNSMKGDRPMANLRAKLKKLGILK